MMAAVLVLDPIFEVDLALNSMLAERGAVRTMRCRRSRQGCATVSRKWWMRICPPTSTTIPHGELMLCVARRVVGPKGAQAGQKLA